MTPAVAISFNAGFVARADGADMGHAKEIIMEAAPGLALRDVELHPWNHLPPRRGVRFR